MFVSGLGYLVVDGFGVVLRKKHGRIVVVSRDGRWEYAFKGIREVVVSGKASISSELLRALAWNGVDLLLTSYTGTPLARLVPAYMGGTARNRVEQYRALEDGRGCIIARDIILAKIGNQASNLKYYSKARKNRGEAEELYDKASQIKSLAVELEEEVLPENIDECRERIMAVEAQAAGIYWDAMRIVLGEYGFRERIKRPEKRKGAKEDIVNKILNTGYNMLAGTLWKYVLRFSLDPYMGYLHAERPGRLSLVYDLMEPYRPIYDRFAASLLRRKILMDRMDARTFYKTLRQKYYEEFLAYQLRYQGRRYKLETTMFLYLESIVSYLNGNRASIKPPRIAW